MANSRLSKSGGILIRDQWQRAGRARAGKRWLYRVWNPFRKSYHPCAFDHDSTTGRRSPGCAEGDAWANWVRSQLMAGVVDPLLNEQSLSLALKTTMALSAPSVEAGVEQAAYTSVIASEDLSQAPSNHASLQWLGARFLEAINDNDHSDGHVQAVKWTLAVAKKAGLDNLSAPNFLTTLRNHIGGLTAQRPGQVTSNPVSGRTKNHHIAILRSIGVFAEDNGYASIDPFRKLKKFQESRTRRKVYSIDDIRFILQDENSESPWYRLVALAAYTGFRSATLTHLTWKMVSLNSNRIHVPAHITKTNSDVLAPIQPELRALLDAWGKSGGPLIPMSVSQRNSDGVNDAYSRFLKSQCGVYACTLSAQGIHAFRHSVASLLTATGVSAFSVMDAIGHDSMESSKHYSQGAEEYRQIVQDEGWAVGEFHFRTLPPALHPFTIPMLKAHINAKSTQPAWLLGTLCIYLGMPAASVARLQHAHLNSLSGSFTDPFAEKAKSFWLPEDLSYLLSGLVGADQHGAIFPASWQELSPDDLDKKLESYWQDLPLLIGRRRAKALWLTIPALRRAAALPSTIEAPRGLIWLTHTNSDNFKQTIIDEGWDEEDLWLMDRRRRRTIHSTDIG